MEILGYIGFGLLVFLALTWVYGVRKELGAGVPTIFGALYFLIAVISIMVTEADKLNTIWIIPLGFILMYLVVMLSTYLPILYAPIKMSVSIFAGIVRIGIPPAKIDKVFEDDIMVLQQQYLEEIAIEKISKILKSQIVNANRINLSLATRRINSPFVAGYLYWFTRTGFTIITKVAGQDTTEKHMRNICELVLPHTLHAILTQHFSHIENSENNEFFELGMQVGLYDANFFSHFDTPMVTNLQKFLLDEELSYKKIDDVLTSQHLK